MKCLSSLRHCTDILVVKASYCRSLPTSSFHVKALGDRCASIARISFVRTTRMSPAASSTLRWCPIVPLGRPSDCAAWFGVLTLAEVVLAAVGAFVLWRRGKPRWTAWWIAFVVALHFMPLAFLLRDWSLIVLGVVQALALSALIPRLSRDENVSSRLVGPVMGVTLLLFAAASIVVFYRSVGLPW